MPRSIFPAFDLTLPAVSGTQAGREYYIVMCPLGTLPKLFSTPDSEFTAEIRAQRLLNKGRIPQLVRYLLDNPETYVLTSLAASVDGELSFIPAKSGHSSPRVGQLRVPRGARFLINDGQHRLAGLRSALKQRPDLADETISIVVYADAGLARSQQMFADLNRYAVRPTRSLNILYDHRDPFASLARELSQSVPVFDGLTETASNTISNRTRKLFTLNAIYHATRRLLGHGARDEISPRDARTAASFWTEVGSQIADWGEAAAGRKHPSDLRRDYVHAHGIALHALGVVGNALLLESPKVWRRRLGPLRHMDWSRANIPQWEGRAMSGGRMCKAGNHVVLTSNLLKTNLLLPLTPAEAAVERTHATPRIESGCSVKADDTDRGSTQYSADHGRTALHSRRQTVGGGI